MEHAYSSQCTVVKFRQDHSSEEKVCNSNNYTNPKLSEARCQDKCTISWPESFYLSIHWLKQIHLFPDNDFKTVFQKEGKKKQPILSAPKLHNKVHIS